MNSGYLNPVCGNTLAGECNRAIVRQTNCPGITWASGENRAVNGPFAIGGIFDGDLFASEFSLADEAGSGMGWYDGGFSAVDSVSTGGTSWFGNFLTDLTGAGVKVGSALLVGSLLGQSNNSNPATAAAAAAAKANPASAAAAKTSGGLPSWVLPVMVGGGFLVLISLLASGKRK